MLTATMSARRRYDNFAQVGSSKQESIQSVQAAAGMMKQCTAAADRFAPGAQEVGRRARSKVAVIAAAPGAGSKHEPQLTPGFAP